MLPVLAEDDEDSGGEGRRDAPLPSVGPAFIVVYLGEDRCREEEWQRGVESREWLLDP